MVDVKLGLKLEEVFALSVLLVIRVNCSSGSGSGGGSSTSSSTTQWLVKLKKVYIISLLCMTCTCMDDGLSGLFIVFL